MQVIDFGAAEARTIADHSSLGLTIAPLARGTDVQVVCLRLDAGGQVGRHDAVGRQVLAVVRGSALVSGSDGLEVRISSGQAAVWAPGESHQTRSIDGLEAVVIEGELSIPGSTPATEPA